MQSGHLPLARLLAIAYRQLIDQLHARLREQGWTDVRVSYGYVLLAARDQPTSLGSLITLLGVSKQATSKIVDAMETAGYVQRRTDPRDARVKVIEIAPRGEALLSAVEEIYASLEAAWAEVIGKAAYQTMRESLHRAVLVAAGGESTQIRRT